MRIGTKPKNLRWRIVQSKFVGYWAKIPLDNGGKQYLRGV